MTSGSAQTSSNGLAGLDAIIYILEGSLYLGGIRELG